MNKRNRDYQRGIRAYSAGDYETARNLSIPFAKEGDSEAQTMMGSMYQLGLGGLEINDDEAIKWYLLASQQGNSLASNNLGTMALQRGDRQAAAQYYEKARKQGFPHAPSPSFVRKHF